MKKIALLSTAVLLTSLTVQNAVSASMSGTAKDDHLVGDDTHNVIKAGKGNDIVAGFGRYFLGTTKQTPVSVDDKEKFLDKGYSMSDPVAFSPSGRYVLFSTLSAVNGENAGHAKVLVERDLIGGTTRIVSTEILSTDDGTPIDYTYYRQSENLIAHVTTSSDGGCDNPDRLVVVNLINTRTNSQSCLLMNGENGFDGWISNVLGFDAVGGGLFYSNVSVPGHVYYRDFSAGKTYDLAWSNSSSFATTPNDRRFSFFTSAIALSGADKNGETDVYMGDITTGDATLISTSSKDLLGNGVSSNPAPLPDGRRVVFKSYASDLFANDSNGQPDILLKDLDTNKTTLLSRNKNDVLLNLDSTDPVVSPNGQDVYFQTEATNIKIAGTKAVLSSLATETVTVVSTDTPLGNYGDILLVAPNGRDLLVKDVNKSFNNLDTNGSPDLFLQENSFQNSLTGDLLFGEEGVDTLYGTRGDDELDGGTAGDRMYGGAGGDIYDVDHKRDVIVELPDEGSDTVVSSINYKLGYNLENLTAAGSSRLSLTGNGLANVITGNDAKNILTGGAGPDQLRGNGGADLFTYVDRSDSFVGASTRDVILDFRRTDRDQIDLKALDADRTLPGIQAFTFIGKVRFSKKPGELRFSKEILAADTDGNGFADFEIKLKGVAGLTVDAFILK